MRICFIGLGYVGLSTAVCMAVKGFKVYGIDVDGEKVKKLERGVSPITEPKIDKLLKISLRKKKLEFGVDFSRAIHADVVFITVGTPSKEDGSIDLGYVRDAAEAVGKVMARGDRPRTVVVKSTVVPGTTRNVVKPVLEQASGKRVGESINLCVNPEFLREGSAVEDTMNPDRVVIGDDWGGGAKVLKTVYRRFYGRKNPPIVLTNTVNAEMIKYASNVFLAARISLINEVANICQLTPGADVSVVAKGVGLDKRIGPHFLNAGLGYGGSCFPKDVKALTAYAKSVGYIPQMLESVQKVNDSQPIAAVKLAEQLAGPITGKKAAILGLSFKPNTDDIREAVALKIIDQLLKAGCHVSVYDPAATSHVQRIYGEKITYASTALECLRDADFCIIATEWDEFRNLKPSDFVKQMKNPVVVDGRRIYDPQIYSKTVRYAAVGLGPSNQHSSR
ncbi:MAG: UDP-glucose/GDP-mannose dehydrogenase family protein [Candidatus Caldarchaeum sp.]|nr:UDP-glucose/GDP-mannose dehydrogenase family protein [Candidatus Caldarchaeum sp.]